METENAYRIGTRAIRQTTIKNMFRIKVLQIFFVLFIAHPYMLSADNSCLVASENKIRITKISIDTAELNP